MNVDDRVRATGFLGGAGNRMNAMAPGMPPGPMRPGAGMPPPLPAGPGGPPGAAVPPPAPESPAPNLREGEPGHECMTCQHYEMAGRHCGLYDFEPKPFEVCDSFAQGSAQPPEEE